MKLIDYLDFLKLIGLNFQIYRDQEKKGVLLPVDLVLLIAFIFLNLRTCQSGLGLKRKESISIILCLEIVQSFKFVRLPFFPSFSASSEILDGHAAVGRVHVHEDGPVHRPPRRGGQGRHPGLLVPGRSVVLGRDGLRAQATRQPGTPFEDTQLP